MIFRIYSHLEYICDYIHVCKDVYVKINLRSLFSVSIWLSRTISYWCELSLAFLIFAHFVLKWWGGVKQLEREIMAPCFLSYLFPFSPSCYHCKTLRAVCFDSLFRVPGSFGWAHQIQRRREAQSTFFSMILRSPSSGSLWPLLFHLLQIYCLFFLRRGCS